MKRKEFAARCKRASVWFISFSLLMVALSASLYGDDSASLQVGWRVLSTQTLAILGSGEPAGSRVASTFVLPKPTPEDLQRGFIERVRAIVLLVRSNTPWIISVRTDDEDMGKSFDGSYTKPISDLWVRAEGGSYVPISREAQVITSGLPGEYQIGVDYRVHFTPDTYREGRYQITVIYMISTP